MVNRLRKKKTAGISILVCAILAMGCLPILHSRAGEVQKKEKICLAAFGDSIARGYAKEKQEALKSYPKLIADSVSKETGIPTEYENLAKNGLALKALNLDVLNTKEAIDALEKADIITLTIGANDLMQETDLTVRKLLGTEQEFTSTHDTFRALQQKIKEDPLSVMKVLGMLEDWDYAAFGEQWVTAMETITQHRKDGSQFAVTDIYNPLSRFELPEAAKLAADEIIQNMNQIMYDHADEYDYHVVNLFGSEICEHTQADGLHPDQKGQELIAKAVMEKIDTGRFMGKPEKQIAKSKPAKKKPGQTILGNIRKVMMLAVSVIVILTAGAIAVRRRLKKRRG